MFPSIVLCMIVKDEAPVIARCLDSVRQFISYWVVVDTGSTDGTQNLVEDLLCGVHGELHERPWVNFAHNRNEALQLAKPHGDFILIIDADDTLIEDPQFVMPELTADAYDMRIDFGPIVYHRPQLIRSELNWEWRGVVHEFLMLPSDSTSDDLHGLSVKINHDGHRRSDPDTYKKDAALMELALETETDPFMRSRYTFYLAQSYRDCGDVKNAIKHYLKRTELGFWEDEIFLSYLYAGRMTFDMDAALELFRKAIETCPERAEARFEASVLCSRYGRRQEAFEFIQPALGIPPPYGRLFVETGVYQLGVEDEYSAACYWIGRYKESVHHCLNLLSRADINDADRTRITQNARFALNNL